MACYHFFFAPFVLSLSKLKSVNFDKSEQSTSRVFFYSLQANIMNASLIITSNLNQHTKAKSGCIFFYHFTVHNQIHFFQFEKYHFVDFTLYSQVNNDNKKK